MSYLKKEKYDAVMAHWDSIAKPIDGLGDFEHIIARIGAITGTAEPGIGRRTLLVFLSDNGIVDEGVSQSKSDVTHAVAWSMSRDESTVCVMARRAGVDVLPVDIGMTGEPVDGIEYHRIRSGTRSFALEPAMTYGETTQAIETGRRMAARVIEGSAKALHKNTVEDSLPGCDILLLGEMGIGNTSTATAVSCAMLGMAPDDVVGRGAGLSSDILKHKCEVISDALHKYGYLSEDGCSADMENNKRGAADKALEVLATLGGYDIAGMVGAIMEAYDRHVPVILDGLITLSAVLVAERMKPGIKDVCIPSHFPREPMGQRILKELGFSRAPIDAGLALGEGTGAVLLMPLLDVCMHLYDYGTRFEGMKLSAYERYK